MRIGWIVPHFSYGEGLAFPWAFWLCQRLRKKGLETLIIAPKVLDEPDYEVIDNIQIFRSSNPYLKLKGFLYPLPINLFWKIREVVKKESIDVLNWHGYHYLHAAYLPLIKRVLKIPTVLTVISFPGVNWYYPVKWIDFISRIYAYTLGKAILSAADRVVLDFSHNYSGAEKLRVAEEKVTCIPWGIDTELFKPMPEKRLEIRNRLGLKDDDFVLGYCGRLSPVKGIDTLIQAVHNLLGEHDNIRLLIIGGAGDSGGNLNMIREYEGHAHSLLNDKVIFTGWVRPEQVPFYLQATDVCAAPSFSESGGGHAAESSACGIPVVASRIGGLQDIVKDKSTGFLVTPGNVGELAGKIRILLENPDLVGRMGREARKHVVENYHWDAIAQKYMELYTSLIENVTG